MQNALKGDSSQIVLVAFDLLHLDGWDLHARRRSSSARRCSRACSKARRRRSATASTSTEDGAEFFAAACRLGLEGIVAKRASDPYRAGERTRSWLKIKCLQREEFVIVGFTDPGGSRTGFGALLVATREERGRAAALRRQGRHGLRRAHAEVAAEPARAARSERRRPSSARRRAASRAACTGSSPKLVAEIAYTEWTGDGRLRHPIFVGLREDKPAAEIVEERAARRATARQHAVPSRRTRSAA